MEQIGRLELFVKHYTNTNSIRDILIILYY
uniref:Uncharacterized protein n=1 Tax=viral metagenome TaxID=1070528 RepID=A0A6C0EFS3_9ZZZZ